MGRMEPHALEGTAYAWPAEPRTEILDRGSIPAFLPHWHALARNAAEDNAYYTPNYALALLDHIDAGRDIRFLLAWRGERLIGLLPVVFDRWRWLGLTRVGVAWHTKFTFSCTPLLDRDDPIEAARGLLEAMRSTGAGAWLIPQIDTGGAVFRALSRALDGRGAPRQMLGAFNRAALARGECFEAHMKQHVASKRRRELARSRRRLAELGAVTHESFSEGPGLRRAVEAFLAIEASGWKGRMGTALASDPATRAFAAAAFGRSDATATCRADVLSLGGAPVAVSLAIKSGRTAFTVKCAFDERYRSQGVGLLLEEDVIRSLFAEAWADRLDSATAGTHVIDELWPQSMQIADLLFAPDRNRPFGCYLALERTRRSCRARLKSLRDRFIRRP